VVRTRQGKRRLTFEPLEVRRLLAVWPALPTAGHAAPTVILIGAANPDSSSSSSQLVPEQVREAYGLDSYNGSGTVTNGINFGSVAGNGAGQTIAIVDAYDDPNAASDLNTFSSDYGLPQFNGANEPTFEKLNQTGGTSLPGTDPSGELNGSNNDWELEESLDIEWAHAMAPMANIILFEASDTLNGLYTAAQTAANTSGVVVVSMSWSGSESSGESGEDSTYFVTPSGHLGGSATMGGTDLAGGVTFLAAAGDSGAYAFDTSSISPQYPASSPNVIAVGGTTLTVNENNSSEYSYGGETSWGNNTSSGSEGGGGGGVSQYESQPSYQSGVVSSTYSTNNGEFSTASPHRVYPDVSADAAGSVLVYDSYSSAGDLWAVEGTSLACPLWAGMITVADQGRAVVGIGSLNGASQTLPELYSLAAGSSYSTYFNNVNTGNANGPPTAATNTPSYSPSIGYDAAYNLATGLGSPKAAALIPEFIGTSMVAFGQGPSNAIAGAAISPSITVDVENSAGQIVTSDTSNVTLSLGSNPSNGRLLGTLTVAAVNGVATFSGVEIDSAGNGYTLVASDGGLTPATSSSFNVAANPSQPIVTTPASASLASPKTANLSVVASDPGSQALTYTWSTLSLPSGASAPTYSVNQSSAAQSTAATFSAAGTYVFLVTITDTSGFSNDSTVSYIVSQSLASIAITPGPVTLSADSQEQFSITGIDQFGNSMSGPSSVTWSAASGTITSKGLYTPPTSGSSDTLTAKSGSLSASDSVTIVAPVGWWKLNEGANSTAKDSGSSPADNGTITSGAWIQPPASVDESSALQFNGSNTVVSLGDPSKLQFTGPITLSAWINPSNISGTEFVIDDGSSLSNNVFLMLSGGSYEVGIDNGSFSGASYTIPSGDANTWVQLAGTYDGSTWRLFRDGQQVASSASSTGATDPSGNWQIGAGTTTRRRGTSLTDYFSGDIGDVRIYSTAISPAAVAGLAAAPPAVTTAASASPNPVTGKTATLSASGTDDAGASTLTYTWATVGAPPAAVTFSANGANAASSTIATFSEPGTYSFVVTITNVAGLTATSSVNVTVNQKLTTIAVSPSSVGLNAAATQQFTATGYDQFGAVLGMQPSLAWTTNVGSITSAGGLLTASNSSVTGTVTATSGGISGNSAANVTDHPPTVATAATATPSVVNGTTTALTALGADVDTGQASLTYTWATTGTPPAPVAFSSVNGTNAGQDTTATFSAAGTYGFTVTIADPGGMTATSSVSATVNQALTTIVVGPASAGLAAAATQQFSATGYDQFGVALATQSAFAWTTNAGSITSPGGVLTASNSSVTGNVTATSGTVSGISTVTVTDNPPTVATPAAATPSVVNGTSTTLTALGADADAGQASLTYTWATTGTPPAPVTFSSVNGTNAGQDTTATFSAAGTYAFTVTIADPGGMTATSTVNVTVNQMLTSITVGPTAVGVNAAAPQQFTATGYDQFGTALVNQPSFTWTTNVGSISSPGGLLTASNSSVTGSVTATSEAVSGSSTVTVTDNPPTVATLAAATPSVVNGTSTTLTALGADVDTGPGSLTYTWATTGTPPAPVAFNNVNGTNAGQDTAATFTAAGTYAFTVTIADPGGMTVTSSVNVTVNQTLTSITVAPASSGLGAAGSQPFTATAFDQFGAALGAQPAFAWSVVGAGIIDNSGDYSPPYTAGSATVVAANGSLTGQFAVSFPGVAQLTSNGNFSWNDPNAWTGSLSGQATAEPGLRGIASDTVALGTSAPAVVALNGVSPSVASVAFETSASDEIAQGSGGTLQLANGSASASITVAAGKQAINAPVAMTSNLVVTPAAGSQLTLSGGISGTGQSLLVNAPGTLVLEGTNSLTGGTTVSAGTLVAASPAALASGTSLSIGAGAASLFGPPANTPAASLVIAAPSATSASPAGASPAKVAAPVIAVSVPAVVTPVRPASLPAAPVTTSRLAAAYPPGESLLAGHIAAELAWVDQTANASIASDQNQNRAAAIQALDALFADYGR
jgi:autotransporter-associated beta strand protein